MNTIKTLKYLNYYIQIYWEPRKGDNTRVYFDVWNNGIKVISFIEKWLRADIAYNYLEKRGMNKINKLLGPFLREYKKQGGGIEWQI